MRLGIHYKITLVFAIIIAGILLGVYFYLNTTLEKHTYQRIRINLLQKTNLAKSYIEGKYSDELGYGLDAIADRIGKDIGLRATIITLSGVVFGDSELDGDDLFKVENHLQRPEVQDAISSRIGESRRFSSTIKKDMFYVASLFGQTAPQGVIRLSIPLSEIELISGHLKKILVAALFLAFLLAIITSFIASILISRPIKEISYAARDIAGGDYSKRISLSTKDEIEDLANAFNFMSEQIKSRIDEISSGQSRLETVLLSMFEGVMVLDSSGAIVLINRTLSDLLQVKYEHVGRKPIEVIRNVEIQELVENTLSLRRGVETREVMVLLPQERILLIHGTPVKKDGKLEGAVLVFHDITELRRLEKVRQDFVANVSHELRTPVSNIKGYAETLLEGALDDQKNASDFLEIIHSDSERLAKIIDDLLELSRIESGSLKMTKRACALEPIVRRIVSGLEKRAKVQSIEIKINIPKTLAKILADEARIAQVFINLIDNAIKYNKENGEVRISIREEGAFIRIDVSDTGVGIPEKDLPRIFERFYRVDKARSRELGGTGLGLSIVKHIVQAHNGEVSVQSVLGQGSTFTFTIPKVKT